MCLAVQKRVTGACPPVCGTHTDASHAALLAIGHVVSFFRRDIGQRSMWGSCGHGDEPSGYKTKLWLLKILMNIRVP
jgi:hypothetical protein